MKQYQIIIFTTTNCRIICR